MQAAALVGRDGSIDWCSFQQFDSGAGFAALIGGPEHGRWLLAAGQRTDSILTSRRDPVSGRLTPTS